MCTATGCQAAKSLAARAKDPASPERSAKSVVGEADYRLCAFCRLSALGVRAPAVDRLEVKAPVTPDLEGRQLSFLQQPVNGRWMHSQVTRHLFQRHHVRH